MVNTTQRLFLLAAEPSGDVLGQAIISGLKQRYPLLRYCGVGGPLMESAGNFTSIIPLSELSVMGVVSIIKRLPFLVRSAHCIKKAITTTCPTALLTIDAPELSLRISQSIRGIPRIHTVAPSVWAWRPKRAHTLRRQTDHLLTLFPFENAYFPHVPSTWVGHPVADQPPGSADAFWSKHGPRQPMVCLLPGSRTSEIKRLLPVFLESAQRLKRHCPPLRVVLVCPQSARWLMDSVPDDILIISDEKEKNNVFAAATVAIAASGTVTLELARHKTSMVVGYRISSLSWHLARRLVTLSHVCLLNILADHPFVPECLQDDCCPDNIVPQVLSLLNNTAQRHNQIQTSSDLVTSLGCPHNTFSQRCAQHIGAIAGL